MKHVRKPSVLKRGLGWLALSPWRIALFESPMLGAHDDEDAFSAGEGGEWFWYPVAGSLRPVPLSRWLRIAGNGAAVTGSVEHLDGRIRFVPSRYWQRRGFNDWSRRIENERREGSWLTIETSDRTALLRNRKNPVD